MCTIMFVYPTFHTESFTRFGVKIYSYLYALLNCYLSNTLNIKQDLNNLVLSPT